MNEKREMPNTKTKREERETETSEQGTKNKKRAKNINKSEPPRRAQKANS